MQPGPVGPDEWWRRTCLVNAILFGLLALAVVLAWIFPRPVLASEGRGINRPDASKPTNERHPMFDDVYKLIDHVKAGQIGDALISQGNLAIKIGEFYNAIIRGEKLAIDDGELNSAISELESCCDDLKKAPKGAADPKEMDPMTILAFIKMGLEALKMFREWRKKRQEG